MILLVLAFVLLWAIPSTAATRLAVAAGGATTGTCTSTPCTLSRAIALAVAGDTVELANGTYTGGPWSTGSAGTNTSTRITLRAATPHAAILTGINTCAGHTATLSINHAFWTIQDIIIRDSQSGIDITNATGITMSNLIVDNFHADGIFGTNADNVIIEDSLIVNGDACVSNHDNTAIGLYSGSDGATIRRNIILGTGNNADQFGGPIFGIGTLIANSNNALVQGNLYLANQGKATLRVLGDQDTGVATASNNVLRDNILLWGEGGFSTDDCSDHATTMLNNLVVGLYHSMSSTKGNTATLGNHIVRHNTEVMNAFSRHGANFGNAGCGGGKKNLTLQDNVLYSPDTMNVGSGEHFLLWVQSGTTFTTANHNLFWGAGGTWTSGYTFGANDIHASGSPPLFVNPAVGDYSLASSSPGYQAGSDSTSMGIAWNSQLRQDWAANAFGLQTAEKTGLTGATSTSFTSGDGVENGKTYMLWFYIPTSACSSSAQQFTIEGTTTNLSRNIAGLTCNNGASCPWTQPGGPARYITLGRHKVTDGTLNVAWQTTNCVERVFMRELPTVTQAYSWLAQLSSPPTVTITAPNSGNNTTVVSSPLTTLAGSGTDDVGVTSVTWSCATCTPTSGTATCGTCGASGTSVTWSVASIGLAPGANVITATANDADTQTTDDQITVTYTPPVAAIAPFRLVR